MTKLWNVARFSQRFIGDWGLETGDDVISNLQSPVSTTPADRWILARVQQLIGRVSQLYCDYDYATAKSEIETFFWRDLADNYLEMAKMRLYAGGEPADGAKLALYTALLTTLKLPRYTRPVSRASRMYEPCSLERFSGLNSGGG